MNGHKNYDDEATIKEWNDGDGNPFDLAMEYVDDYIPYDRSIRNVKEPYTVETFFVGNRVSCVLESYTTHSGYMYVTLKSNHHI